MLIDLNTNVIVDRGEKHEVRGKVIGCFFSSKDKGLKYAIMLKACYHGYIHSNSGNRLGYISMLIADAGNVEIDD